MDYLNKVMEVGVSNMLINILVVTASLLFVVKLFQECKKVFGIKTVIDTDKEDYEERLSRLEKKIRQLESTDDKILETLKMIQESATENNELNRHYIIANGRSALYRMHKEFMEQGYVDKEGLTTFVELGKIYEKSGGNDVYHDKLYPEVTSLPVR